MTTIQEAIEAQYADEKEPEAVEPDPEPEIVEPAMETVTEGEE